jgi:hypothetical protein
MRLKELVFEGITDNIRGSMYRNLGIGGEAGNELAAKQNFISRFKQQVKLNQKTTGFDSSDLQQMVDSYLSQYGWVANQKDRLAISNFIQNNDIDSLANQMYLVGNKQLRDPSTGSAIDPSKLSGSKQTNTTQYASTTGLNNTTKTIISQPTKLTGSSNLDDLEQITKHAMQQLYKMSPSSYQKLYKEIVSGATKASTDATQAPTMSFPAKGTPEYFAAKRSLATQKARSTMVPK